MASCVSADAVKLQDNESEEFKRGTKNHQLKINTILKQLEKLKEEMETETENCKSRVNVLLRHVKKLQKEESELVTKTTELRTSKKGIVRLFVLGMPIAKLLYDRDSTGKDAADPIVLHDLPVYSQLAINAYNKRHSTEYMLVEVVRAFRSLPISYFHTLYLMFTANLLDDDAKTFRAEMFFGIDHIHVSSVDIVDAPAISPLVT